MGPDNHAQPHDHVPTAENSALMILAAYSRTFDIKITASKGAWRIEGGGLAEAVAIDSYTEMVTWLAQTFGWPRL